MNDDKDKEERDFSDLEGRFKVVMDQLEHRKEQLETLKELSAQ